MNEDRKGGRKGGRKDESKIETNKINPIKNKKKTNRIKEKVLLIEGR